MNVDHIASGAFYAKRMRLLDQVPRVSYNQFKLQRKLGLYPENASAPIPSHFAATVYAQGIAKESQEPDAFKRWPLIPLQKGQVLGILRSVQNIRSRRSANEGMMHGY